MIGSLPQQADAIQKVYKIDVSALYSRISFAVQRMKWKSFTSPMSVYAVSPRTLGLVPAWHRFTQTYFCTFVSLTCPPTEQLAPQCQLTPHPSQFPQIWHMMRCVLDNTWMPYFQSNTFSLPKGIWLEVISTPFLDLDHYRLTLLLNHSIHWLPQLQLLHGQCGHAG